MGKDGPLANIGYPLWTSGTGRPSGPFLLSNHLIMVTKVCPKCSESIMDSAKKCKHCQADLRNWFVRHPILSVFLGFIALGVLGSLGGGETTQSTTAVNEPSAPQEVLTISAGELYSEYEANEISADSKYKGKTLEISGSVKNIGKDILDTPYVSLKTGNIIGTVQCMLKGSEAEKAGSLSEGQFVTMVGKNPSYLLNVIMRSCVIK